MPLRAAVFDFDGVIVNSEPLHFRSLQAVLRTEGVEITEEEYFSSFLGDDDRGAVRRALEHNDQPADPDRVERLASLKVARFAELIPEVPVFDGAADLVRKLAAEVPLAIASGARRAELDKILRGVGLHDAFVTIVGAEDAPRTKPDPAPYLEAARRLAGHFGNGLPPADCLALEDSVPGIASARAAGMKVLAVANSYPAEKLQAAHRVVDSLVGLQVDDLRGLFGS
jgi:beta-phosphoglucomutase